MRIIQLIPLLTTCLLCWQVSTATKGPEIADYLRKHLSPESNVFLPMNGNWTNETTPRWNLWNAPTYVVAVKPALREDVQIVIKYANEKDVPFLTTGGGHGYSGTLGALKDGIELDMGNFDEVVIDSEQNLMTAGPGLRFRDVTPKVYAAGKAFTVGACPCVGIAGATLGGGIGFYSGLYGAISDSLTSVDIVTGTGEFLTASDTENKELFWGVKGAGFNFGSVTSFTYRVRDYPNDGDVMTADFTFLVSQLESVFEYSKSFFGNQPKEMSMVIAMQYNADTQQIGLIVNVIYVGPLEDGKRIVQPLIDLGPINPNITYLPWNDAAYVALYGFTAQACLSSATEVPNAINLYSVNIPAVRDIADYISDSVKDRPELQGITLTFTQHSQFGFEDNTDGKQELRGRVGSAFPWRKPTIFCGMDGFLENADDAPAMEAFGKSIRDRLLESSGQGKLETYVNLANGNEGEEAWYTAERLPRLKALKEKYDPYNLFSFYNSINSDGSTDIP